MRAVVVLHKRVGILRASVTAYTIMDAYGVCFRISARNSVALKANVIRVSRTACRGFLRRQNLAREEDVAVACGKGCAPSHFHVLDVWCVFLFGGVRFWYAERKIQAYKTAERRGGMANYFPRRGYCGLIPVPAVTPFEGTYGVRSSGIAVARRVRLRADGAGWAYLRRIPVSPFCAPMPTRLLRLALSGRHGRNVFYGRGKKASRAVSFRRMAHVFWPFEGRRHL